MAKRFKIDSVDVEFIQDVMSDIEMQGETVAIQEACARRGRWRKFLLSIAAIVVFCTTYWLILPAVAFDNGLVCELEEHAHSAACYSEVVVTPEKTELVCNIGEHVHSDACYEMQNTVVCGMEEHSHVDSCYGENGELVCGMEEHSHTDGCYEAARVLTCGQDEHKHSDKCYKVVPAVTEKKLTCGKEEHKHTEACYDAQKEFRADKVTKAVDVVSDEGYHCGKVAHKHTDACYDENGKLTCGKEEHKHTEACKSNPKADVEDSQVWEDSMKSVILKDNWAENVLKIAESQMGYKESTANFTVDKEGRVKGYSRYGAWYGDPYGDWCAMFCSFCLHYAGVNPKYIPQDSNCQNWISQLKSDDFKLYRSAEGKYSPMPGDLVFFDFDSYTEKTKDQRVADHIGFVKEIKTEEVDGKKVKKLVTVEGNAGSSGVDSVCENEYKLSDDIILGFGSLPLNPKEDFSLETVSDNGIQVTVEGQNGSLPKDSRKITLSAVELTGQQAEEAQETLESALDEQGIEAPEEAVILDVSLLYYGKNIEPTGPVTLSFNAGDVVEPNAVYHVDEANGEIQEMEATVKETASGEVVLEMETDHFSTYALVRGTGSAKNVEGDIEATWDSANKQLATATVSACSTELNNAYYGVQTSTNGGSTWSGPNSWSEKTAKNATATFNVASTLNNGSLTSQYRILGTTNTSQTSGNNTGYSESFTIYNVLDTIKEGFSAWVADAYINVFERTQPTTLTELFDAFDLYYSLPTAIMQTYLDEDDDMHITVATNTTDSYEYKWEYQDDLGGWAPLMSDDDPAVQVSGDDVNVQELSALNPPASMGEMVRAVVYSLDDGKPLAVSNAMKVAPMQAAYDQAALAINEALNLDEWPVYTRAKNGTPSVNNRDLSIGGDRWQQSFYYKNVLEAAGLGSQYQDIDASDTLEVAQRKTAENALLYKNYLAQIWLTAKDEGGVEAATEAVRAVWTRYVFDMYDPAEDMNDLDNVTAAVYSEYTYGDQGISWPKNKTYDSFNTPSDVMTPTLDSLDADWLERNVTYDDIVSTDSGATGVRKTVKAVLAGDANVDRKYNVNLEADVRAKADAPIAMIVQVQTSWQMFDLEHANAREGGNVNYTTLEVGAGMDNTDIASLFEIKQGLLDFADYMNTDHVGNNLIFGLTEVRHDDSSSLFYKATNGGKDGSGMYVTNDYNAIQKGLEYWNTFGNCEHVHYDSDNIEAAVKALPNNLASWTDTEGNPIPYDKIRKVVVVIGGATENAADDKGYGITSSWSTFSASGIDSVYAIRTNEGTPLNTAGAMSWLDWRGGGKNGEGNMSGNNYENGTGTKWSVPRHDGADPDYPLYVALDAEDVRDALVEIAEWEMSQDKMIAENEAIYIENTTITDTIKKEFELNRNVPITAIILDKNGNVTSTEPLDWDDENLTIVPNADGTTSVTYNFGDAYNMSTVRLSFQIQAKESYIGSNNVFSNVDTPSMTYEHTPKDATGNPDPTATPEEYTVGSNATPEVNVPIRYGVANGGSTTVVCNTPVDLASLNSEAIVADLHRAIYEDYEQITGTVSYEWIDPDGTRHPVLYEVRVKDGEVLNDLPDASDLQQVWTPMEEGDYTGKLVIRFTPDDAVDNGNYSDANTKAQVNYKEKSGEVYIKAVDATSKLKFYVVKEWVPEAPSPAPTIQFVMSDGQGQYMKQAGNDWSFVDTSAQATVFELDESNDWMTLVEDLPAVKEVDGATVILNYMPEELNSPEGFTPEYESGEPVEDTAYYGQSTVTFDNGNTEYKDVKKVVISYTYNGQNGTYTHTYDNKTKIEKNKSYEYGPIVDLPALANTPPSGAYGSVTVNSITFYDDKGVAKGTVTADLTASTVTMQRQETVSTNSLKIINRETSPDTVQVTLTKTVEGSDTTESFSFEAVADGYPFPDANPDTCGYTLNSDNTVASFRLAANQSVTLQVSKGTELLIRETEHDGYKTVFIDDEVECEGDEYVIDVADVMDLEVKNIAGYELPKSGGIGTTLFYVLGIALLAGALIFGCMMRRRLGRGDV